MGRYFLQSQIKEGLLYEEILEKFISIFRVYNDTFSLTKMDNLLQI